jgi:SAM-dependent methyltransferase
VPEERKDREAAFHDHAFTDHTREALCSSYYLVADAPYAHYDELIRTRGRDGRVLEYGCGAGGRSGGLLADGASRIAGIDISPEAVRLATERSQREGYADRVGYQVMDAERLEFDDESFDLICGTSILHHLDLGRAYPELARVLAPGGSAVFLEPLGHNPAINLYRRLTPSLRTEDEHPLLLGDIETAGSAFGSVAISYFTLLPLLAVPLRRTRIFERLLARLNAADQALFDRVPPSRRLAWQVVIELREPR